MLQTKGTAEESIQDLFPDRFYDSDEEIEDLEESDFPALNLGTESLAATPRDATFGLGMSSLSRKRSLSRLSSEGRIFKQSNTRRADVDMTCMICFHPPQRPSRTKCCGKLFCEDHLHDWLDKSSNQCPSCSAYCHPNTHVISLAPPASPTASSPQNIRDTFRYREHLAHDNVAGRNTEQGYEYRCQSPSPSSTSDSSSADLITDHDDEDKSVQAKTENSTSLQSLLVKFVRHLLDDSSPEASVPEVNPNRAQKIQDGTVRGSRVEGLSTELLPSPSGHSSFQSQALQVYDTPPHQLASSEVVSDPELTAIELVGKVLGKVLSIVALLLVFWVLSR
ncbi:hypothetical protein EV361DRAFT_938667 [Lentinula raphanica]|nr:hypothetical protein EV361DRAFT_938667 [Lentinula raphanica]